MGFAKIRFPLSGKIKAVETANILNFNKYLEKKSSEDLYTLREDGRLRKCTIFGTADTKEEAENVVGPKRFRFPKFNTSDIMSEEEKELDEKEKEDTKKNDKSRKRHREDSEKDRVSGIVKKFTKRRKNFQERFKKDTNPDRVSSGDNQSNKLKKDNKSNAGSTKDNKLDAGSKRDNESDASSNEDNGFNEPLNKYLKCDERSRKNNESDELSRQHKLNKRSKKHRKSKKRSKKHRNSKKRSNKHHRSPISPSEDSETDEPLKTYLRSPEGPRTDSESDEPLKISRNSPKRPREDSEFDEPPKKYYKLNEPSVSGKCFIISDDEETHEQFLKSSQIEDDLYLAENNDSHCSTAKEHANDLEANDDETDSQPCAAKVLQPSPSSNILPDENTHVLAGGIKIRKNIWKDIERKDDPSKFVNGLARAIWGEETLANRCVVKRSNVQRDPLTPEKVAVVKDELDNYLTKNHYPERLKDKQIKKLNSWLGHTISTIRRNRADKENKHK